MAPAYRSRLGIGCCRSSKVKKVVCMKLNHVQFLYFSICFLFALKFANGSIEILLMFQPII
jgi:hypothetical protein